MATLTQANRQFQVTTTLGKDVLLFGHMSAREDLSGLYKIDLNLFSEAATIKAEQILGTPVCVTVDRSDMAAPRYFHGLCSQFAYVESLGSISVYHATLRPWLWFLTRSSDCRIFQKQKTPEIIKSIFREHGFDDVRDTLTRSYDPPWEYCVQYRETAFNFVSRLMEHEASTTTSTMH
jgi:type VI secretion system secreted protein VgrG